MAVLSVAGCRLGLEAQHDGAAVRLAVTALLLAAQQVHQGAAGHLVLAGILERQADELMQAYAPWVQLDVADAEDGWILMTARR